MSTNQIQKIDIQIILKNLKDLNSISQKFLKEMDRKNDILEMGLNDCQLYRLHIDNINTSTEQ